MRTITYRGEALATLLRRHDARMGELIDCAIDRSNDHLTFDADSDAFKAMLRPAPRPKPSRGLGDTIAKVTSFFGVKPCGGCNKRKAALNRLVPYKTDERRVHLFGGLGDITAASGALRDLKLAHPNIKLHIRHWAAALFQGCPWVDSFERSPAVKACDVQLREGEQLVNVPVGLYGTGDPHLQILYTRQLERATGLTIPVTKLGGDVRLTAAEKAWQPPWPTDRPVCILDAGCKSDFEVKLPHTGELQRLVHLLSDRYRFVQVGGRDHYHPRLDGAYDFVRPHGPESRWRDFRWTIVAMYRAELVITPVSWPMHLAAALETPDGMTRRCIVLGGGRENPKLTQYPGHAYLSTIGELPCCQTKACWKMRVAECERPAETGRDDKRTGECMRHLTAERIAEAVEASAS